MEELALQKKDLIKINDYTYEIPTSYRSDMVVPARFYANESMMNDLFSDRALWQLVNMTTLPGIQRYAFGMPDIHQGYGFPIGGVLASALGENGVISPGGIGYDINCGVRLLTVAMSAIDLKPYLGKLATCIFNKVPSGVGRGGRLKFKADDIDTILVNGAHHMIALGYGNDGDTFFCEENGRMDNANPDKVSDKAKKRGADQIGTLGSGNHFLEIQAVDKIYNKEVADVFGLQEGMATVMIHCGSRGLGHQTCTDYLRVLNQKLPEWNYTLPDRELIYAPFGSSEGQDYFAAMAAAANFAWANRHMIGHWVREAFEEIVSKNIADNLIVSLSQTFKTHLEIAFRSTQTYLRRKEPENALLTIDAYLNNSPRRQNNFIFYFLKTNIYVQLNQYAQALENIHTCLEMHPHFDKGWLLYASLYEREGNLKEALSGYATFLELSGGNKQIEQHLFTLILKYKTIEDNKKILLSHTISIDNALLLFKQQRYPQALAHINSCIEQQPTNNECKLLKIQILSAMKNFNQITQTISAWIIADPNNDLWPKTLCLLTYNGMPRTEIIETFASILKQTPDNLWCNLYCADMCMRNAQQDQAMHYLTNALSCTTSDAMHAKTLYQLALLHYEQGDYEAMRTNLENAYALNAQCPHINNTLAYYWATKGKDTTKAHSFIEKSLAANSTNPYFLDTQALILYKEKEYLKAQQILEPLADLNNGTMLLHLAKIHYALNNTENADTFTKKAEPLVKNNTQKKALQKMQLRLAQT